MSRRSLMLLLRPAIACQYAAALEMLGACIDRANPDAWLAPVGKFPFWHVAYHVLFTTDLYLSPSEAEFRPLPFHQKNSNFLGPPPWDPTMKVVIDRPYDHPTLLSFLDHCRAKAKAALSAERDDVLAGPSGFDWLKFSRLELHLYNIRHLQHHTGQLTAALRRAGVEGARWSISETL